MIEGWGFNPPPNWPKPPGSWMPPAGWLPDPEWGPVPPGWQLWIPDRRVQRKRGRPVLGLAAVLAAVVLAVVVPRSDGPGVDDPLAGGVAILSPPLPALIATEAPATPTASPVATPSTPATTSSTSSAAPTVTPVPTVTAVPTVAAAPAVPVPHPVVIRAYLNCARLNLAYPNGVGLPTAVDRTTGKPVTAFGRSATIYRANLKHDRDGDGIACEPS
jgi:hypothetical protein